MTGRTYGVYALAPDEPGADHVETVGLRGSWHLRCVPAISTRIKRVYGRAQPSQSGTLTVRHSLEVARDLTWFTERYPLRPQDPASERLLQVPRPWTVSARSGFTRSSPAPDPRLCRSRRPWLHATTSWLRCGCYGSRAGCC